MKTETAIAALKVALAGTQAHPDPQRCLEGLDADTAAVRPDGFPRGIHEIVGHLVWWQDLTLRWLAGGAVEAPGGPEEAWPVGPDCPGTWETTATRFLKGLEEVRKAALAEELDASMRDLPEVTRLECLQTIATHNSYHLGQIVMLRRALGAWPPATDR